MLFAGGKFGGAGYQVSGGLHGVGASVVNALSSHLSVEVKRDGFLWTQSYKRGVPTAALKKGSKVEGTGTKITFQADKEIFETTDYSFETLATRFREMAFLNKGLALTLPFLSSVRVSAKPLFKKAISLNRVARVSNE